MSKQPKKGKGEKTMGITLPVMRPEGAQSRLTVSEKFMSGIYEKWHNELCVVNIAMEEVHSQARDGNIIIPDPIVLIQFAMKTGILVGKTREATPQEFIERFEKEVLNDEWPDESIPVCDGCTAH